MAAKSVLLNLSASLTHRNTIPLGPLPMNIYSTPPDVIAKVTGFLRSILPAVVVESMSIKSLNSERIYPKSDGETLSAGRGQLVARTTLVIDDSKMLEGKLQDTGTIPLVYINVGVRNLRFLSRVATAQKLGFEFPYHEFETDTDISVLVLGTSKTILPVSPYEIQPNQRRFRSLSTTSRRKRLPAWCLKSTYSYYELTWHKSQH